MESLPRGLECRRKRSFISVSQPGGLTRSLSRNSPPASSPTADSGGGASLGSLVCRRLAFNTFVVKSRALDVLFRLGTNQCHTSTRPLLVPLPGPLPFQKQVPKSEEMLSAFVSLQHKYLVPVAVERH